MAGAFGPGFLVRKCGGRRAADSYAGPMDHIIPRHMFVSNGCPDPDGNATLMRCPAASRKRTPESGSATDAGKPDFTGFGRMPPDGTDTPSVPDLVGWQASKRGLQIPPGRPPN